MRNRAYRGTNKAHDSKRGRMQAGLWDDFEDITPQKKLSNEMKAERRWQKENTLPGIVTPMTNLYSLAFLSGEDDAKHGNPASPPDDGDADHWLAYMDGYARDPNLLPWEE